MTRAIADAMTVAELLAALSRGCWNETERWTLQMAYEQKLHPYPER